VHRRAIHAFFLLFFVCGNEFRRWAQTVLTPVPAPHRLLNRHTFGLAMPTSTGIAFAMERKGSRPCRETRSQSRYRVHQTRAKYLPRYDHREYRPSVQVDDIAVACSDPTVAQGLIDSIGKVVDHKHQESSAVSIELALTSAVSTSRLGQTFSVREARFQAHPNRLLHLLQKSSLLRSDQLKAVPSTDTQSPSLHVTHLLPTDGTTLP
jgi:hypothetical protein